jgi:hypothetical protein
MSPRNSLLRRRFLALYGIVTVAIAASFLWQMFHGLCPVP